jgi:hypothetical protein
VIGHSRKEFEREKRIVTRSAIAQSESGNIFKRRNGCPGEIHMMPIRVMAISTELAAEIRTSTNDPQFGFPVNTIPAPDGIPCRHCLTYIVAGVERGTLFTFDAFAEVEKLPLPGPVYIHADGCTRYPEDGGLPIELMASPRTLNAYARGRRLLAQEYVGGDNAQTIVERLLRRVDVDYLHVRSTTAGCYTFRIERATEAK